MKNSSTPRFLPIIFAKQVTTQFLNAWGIFAKSWKFLTEIGALPGRDLSRKDILNLTLLSAGLKINMTAHGSSL